MERLREERVLELWERGRSAGAHTRALLLLEAARPELSSHERAELALGRRDGALLDLRAATFGQCAPSCVACPQCGEEMEFEIDLTRIRVPAPDEGLGPFRLVRDPFTVTFRLPSSADLQAAAMQAGGGALEVRALLLARIVLGAERAGDRVAAAALPEPIVEAIEQELERLDPQADVRFAQACPACAHRFTAPFDIGAYLWHELDVHARRLLQEVDALARAYGWSEPQILALSGPRRASYLALCGAR